VREKTNDSRSSGLSLPAMRLRRLPSAWELPFPMGIFRIVRSMWSPLHVAPRPHRPPPRRDGFDPPHRDPLLDDARAEAAERVEWDTDDAVDDGFVADRHGRPLVHVC